MTVVEHPVDLTRGRVALSLREFLSLPGDARAEIVDGVLRPMTRETRRNRTVQHLLHVALEAQAPSEILVMQEEVLVLAVDPAVARIPDVVVVRADPDDDGRTNSTPAARALLAVEIVSPSTRSADFREKPVEYALAGIPGFWRIEVERDVVVTTHQLVADHYVVAGTFTRHETVHDAVLPWAAIEVAGLLGRYAP